MNIETRKIGEGRWIACYKLAGMTMHTPARDTETMATEYARREIKYKTELLNKGADLSKARLWVSL